MGTEYLGGQFMAACLSVGSSSFADFLSAGASGLLPGAQGANAPGLGGPLRATAQGQPVPDIPHGTTIVAVDFDGGVIMAGDRRSTAGNMIAQRDIEKVFRTDDFSCVGISGVAGIGLEVVRLFQLELEHYEKIEGRTLSLDGKANRLATFVRSNLGGAMQGLVVIPLFRLRRRGGQGPHLQLRRRGRALRGAQVPWDRLGLGVRAWLAEEALYRPDAR